MKTLQRSATAYGRCTRLLSYCIAACSLGTPAASEAVTVDAQFHSPMLTAESQPYRVFSRPDGTFFMARNFNRFNSEDRGPLLKFTATRTLDTSFRMPSGPFQVNTVAFAPDGALFVAVMHIDRLGRFYSVVRLKADGSPDPTFTAGRSTSDPVNSIAVQADGKVVVAGTFTQWGGQERHGVVRLNTDGSVDTTFAPTTLNGQILSNIVLQPDGKILIAGNFYSVNDVNRYAVARLNPNGTVDTTFNSTAAPSSISGIQPIRGLALEPDGHIILAGRFQFGLDNAAPLARVNAEGKQTAVFGPRPRGTGFSQTAVAYHVDRLPNGNIIALGDRVYCFTPTGESVPGYDYPTLLIPNFGSMAVRPDGSVFAAYPLLSGAIDLVRFSDTGAREDIDLGHFGRETLPDQIATRGDGKIWLAYEPMDFIDQVPAKGVARLNADGSVDSQFDAAAVTGFRYLSGFALESTGRILLHSYGAFSSQSPNGLARLNAGDSVDSTLQNNPGGLEFTDAFALRDGKYLVVHARSPRAIMTDSVVHRLLPNGQRDESFDFAINFEERASNGWEVWVGDARPLAFYADGKFLMRYFDSTGNYKLQRFHADGALDESFATGSVPAVQTSRATETVYYGGYYDHRDVIRAPGTALTAATLLPDGRILVTGAFTQYNGTPVRGIVRLQPEGSVDPTFNPGAGAQWTTIAPDAAHLPRVDAVQMLGDGKLLITGDFDVFDGKPLPGVARLEFNGRADDSFVPPVELYRTRISFGHTSEDTLPVSQLVPQRDGTALLSGNFGRIGTNAVQSIIRLTGFPKHIPLNISTRLNVRTGDNVLIGGFIITGTAPKKVVVRALGSSLARAGIAGALADPTVELQDAAGIIASNDNWKDSQQSEIAATGVQPEDELESAIVRTLSPGAYTAVVRGRNGGTGVGLIEMYDLDQGADSQLANISTRGFVQSGDNVMIGGFILGGSSGELNVLVRALGPSLGDAGVAGALEDPTLELRDNNGDLVAENDDWKSTQEAAIRATTIPPKRDEEAAILASLPPGPYTAIVRGKNATTGVGLVEVYNVQ